MVRRAGLRRVGGQRWAVLIAPDGVAGCEPCRELRGAPRRWRGVAEESFGSGSLGQPSTTSALPVKEMWCSAALGFCSPGVTERDDSLIIHGQPRRRTPERALAS